MQSGDYTCTHWHWEGFPDREFEYTLTAVWEYEHADDIPDNWELKELEVVSQDKGAPDLDLRWQGPVWMKIEADGPEMGTLEKIHYIDF